ncbi:T9SS type A sorting domain-containing protein [Crocinitomicaceae bacterium]|nr:T9SS type A sorting domain-containing protein [Crocinitomicaceae bacterium]
MKTLLLALLLVPMLSFGQNVNVPDIEFKNVLVNNTAINTNGDNEIQVSEANAFTGFIDCSFQNISDLTGIEAFTALTILRCQGNQLISLDISSNTALTILRCQGNQLISLDISSNTALTKLVCYENQLTSLDVSTNTALEVLLCYTNGLTSLDVSSNTSLTSLDCYGNQLTSLDVSSNTALEVLFCYTNELTSLDVSNNTALTDLRCQENYLISFDISSNTALTELVCYENQLTSLDVSTNTALEVLFCYINELTSLDVSNNAALTELVCYGNQLVCLNVKNNNNVAFNNFDANNNPNLSCIEVDNVNYSTTNWTTSIDSLTSFNTNCYDACTCLPTSSTDIQNACDSYTWIDGNTYTVSNNTAMWTETNAAGCDSVVTLDLTINYSNTGTDVITACDSYTWVDGNTYTATNNTATWTETNVAGCDSLVTLDLTINYSNTGTDVITACDSYTWVDGNTYTATNNTATWTETNVAGCDSIVTLNLTVNPNPNLQASNNQNVCEGTVIALNATGAETYTWSNGVQNGQVFIPYASATYYVTGSNNYGCSSIDSTLVTVNSNPILNPGIPQTVCYGDTVTLVATGALSYDWSGGIINNQPFSVYTSNTYIVTGFDQNLCSSIAQVSINVTPPPISNAGLDKTISCLINQNGANIGSLPNSLVNYSWSPLVGLSSPNSSLTNANPSTTTSYTLTSTDQNSGCISSDNITVFVDNTQPTAFAGNDNTINCISNINGLDIGMPPSLNTSYSWTPSIGLNNSNISSPLATPNNSDTYVLLVTNDINGCSSTDNIAITVDNTLPIVNAGSDQSICIGESIILNGSGQGNVAWSPSFNLSSASVLDPLSNPNTSTLYTLSITASNGCQNSDEIIITVNQIPEIDLGSNISICQGDSVEMNISTSGNQIIWTGIGINETGNSITFLPNTSDYLVATISDALGCSNSDSVFITIIETETPEIIGDSVVCGNSFWEEYSTTSNFNSLDWTVGNGTIMGSTNPYNILVHWNQQDSGIVYLEAMSNDNACFTQNELIVDFSGLAPDTTIIDHISNSNVLYAQQSFPIMRWGYTSTINNSSIYTCENSQYCNFINFDPLFYTYWVETGEDFNCLTKTYYNKPEYYLSLNNEEYNKDIFIYPNPTEGLISIESSYLSSGSTLELVDASGKGVLYFKIQDGITKMDISNLESGIYYLKSETIKTPIKIVKI